MTQLRRLTMLIALMSGCDEWGNIESPFADDPLVGAASCADLDGSFLAESLELTAFDDPDLFEDFGGAPDFTTDLDFDQGLFTSSLTLDGEVFTSTGVFTPLDDRLIFEGPFFSGIDDTIVLDCGFDGDRLLLEGDVGFDFADDDLTGFVNSTFAGALTPF